MTMALLRALLVLMFILSIATSADARKRRTQDHHGRIYSAAFIDESRRAIRAQDRNTRPEGRSARAAEFAETAMPTQPEARSPP